MSAVNYIYRGSLALLTDLYQITMAYAYWKSGISDRRAVFHLFFRDKPFDGGYAIASGLEFAIDYLQRFKFIQSDINYLASLTGNDGTPLLDEAFLDYLLKMKFSCDVEAIPEGTAVFSQEPLIRVKGPILQAQLIETPLLNIINFQTLVATKAARIAQAAGNSPVLEFGLRRAQGFDGAISASRAAFIGGCKATSNVLAGKLFDIPVSGTHAHSWVMAFEQELEAFREYARAMPNNCILLVDTYDTVNGIKNAIAIGNMLKDEGKNLYGIRIDSGDLAYLSQVGRTMLDEAGLENTKIVASNDIDEYILESLEDQDAKIDLLGIGTKLVTAFDQPALGGVYKLSALQDENGNWNNKIKLSEQSAKVNNPGIQQVMRFKHHDLFVADMIYDERKTPGDQVIIVDPIDNTRRKKIVTADFQSENLLQPVFRSGKLVYTLPKLPEIQQRTMEQMSHLHNSIKRFINPHAYVTGLEKSLFDEKNRLIMELRHFSNGN